MARLRTHNNRRKIKAAHEENRRWIERFGMPFNAETLARLAELLEGVEPLGDAENIGHYLVDEFAKIFEPPPMTRAEHDQQLARKRKWLAFEPITSDVGRKGL